MTTHAMNIGKTALKSLEMNASQSSFRWKFALPLAAVVMFAIPQVSGAQQNTPVSSEVSSAIARARVLAQNGEDAKSRTLLDSLLGAAPRESIDAGEVLFWRAQLTEDVAQSERDWKRIVVDVPFSPRAGDALLQLSELDMTRNNRALARTHVQQLLNDYPDSPVRSRALLILARTYFDERDAPRACGILSAVRREAPLSAVEVRLQADELQQQCRGVREVALGAAPDTTTKAPPAANTVPPLATQTAGLPPARGAAANSNAAVRADSIRRDSVAKAIAARTTAATRDSIRRDSVVKATATRTAAREAAEGARRDSISRVIAQRVADSVYRDSVAKAGLLRAAAQRNAENARRESIAREAARRDSIALDTMGRGARGNTNAGSSGTAPPTRSANTGRINADSARADTLAREAAALEARVMGAVARRDSLRKDSLAAAAARRAAAKSGKWTVQIAAYQTKADANALVKRLSAKNVDAHIAGTKKPFRVQVGRYATRAEAAEALANLKKNGQKTGFVAEVGK